MGQRAILESPYGVTRGPARAAGLARGAPHVAPSGRNARSLASGGAPPTAGGMERHGHATTTSTITRTTTVNATTTTTTTTTTTATTTTTIDRTAIATDRLQKHAKTNHSEKTNHSKNLH